jgi:hypothetical protein
VDKLRPGSNEHRLEDPMSHDSRLQKAVLAELSWEPNDIAIV